jgi:transposase InsO family protein
VSGSAKKAAELLDEIIHRFGLPNSIITDLGSTFTGNNFWNFCDDRGIVVKYVSVVHPRANGQAERANGMILDALKKMLYKVNDKHPGRWLKELSVVIWGPSPVAIPTSPRTSWSSTLMLCCQLTLLSSHHGSRTMTRRGQPRPESLRLIAPRNTALTPARARLNIWKACADTITAMSRTNFSWSAIWFCEVSRRQKDCIS